MNRTLEYVDRALDVLSGDAWQQLLLTLAHGLWQGIAVAAVLWLALARIASNRPNARYGVSLGALAICVILCLVTWSVLDVRAAAKQAAPGGSDTELAGGNPKAATRSAAPDDAATFVKTTPASASVKTWGTLLSAHWRRWAGAFSVAWLVGVGLMFVRVAWLVTGAKRWAHGKALTDERILQMLDDLRARLHIGRAIAVVDAGTVGPAVFGVLRPVLLLPASMLSGMPADCVEAILAHELAHIRRHDYLVNLVQMFVEAILFFNPAIWWINRQIRREREACCDALAIAATGEAVTYVEALARWIENSRAAAPIPAAALAMHGRGSTLDRVRRILVAGYRPELRASWQALVCGLFVSALALGILWRGTQTGVALAADILSPAERLEQLSQERDELRPLAPEDEESSQVTISGTILTPDGKPVSGGIYIDFDTRSERHSASSGVSNDGPKFSHKIPFGTTRLMIAAPGYAPTLAGPWQTKPGETLGGLKITLEPGFACRLRVINDKGEPVDGASATVFFSATGSGIPASWKSNASGDMEIQHASKEAYSFTITAPGYQTAELKNVHLNPDKVTEITLKPAKPTTGVVVSPDGNPIAGAKIRCAAQLAPGIGGISGNSGPILATTNDLGRFTLDHLDEGTAYWLIVETDTNGRRLFPDIKSGQRDLRWTVGPDFKITGMIEGDLGTLERYNEKPIVVCSQPISIFRDSHNSVYHSNNRAVVEQVDGHGRFQIHNLLPGKASITAGKHHIKLDVTKPNNDVTIDLNESAPAPKMRRVVLRFVGADKGISPSGEIQVVSNDVNQVGSPIMIRPTIKNHVIEFDAYERGPVSYSVKNIVGYWFQDGSFMVEPGEGPLEHDIAILPAGAVRGRIVNADGSHVEHCAIGARGTLEISPGQKVVAHSNVSVNAKGEFFLSPLPFGTNYVLRAWRGFETATSDPIWVDDENVSPVVELKFPPVKSATVEVVGPDDKPRAGIPVQLVFSYPKASISFSRPLQTDARGRCTFEGLSTGVGDYYAQVVFEDKTKQPPAARLNLGGEPVQIELLEETP